MGGGIFLWVRHPAPLRPFEAAGRALYHVATSIKSYRTLATENTTLKTYLEKQSIERAQFEIILKENNELKQLLSYRTDTKKTIHPARIATRIKDPFALTLRIDQGAQEGIKKDAPVVVGNGIYLGTVAAVYQHTSDVLVALDPRSKVRAHVILREGGVGVLEGNGVLYRLTMVPTSSTAENGDLVVVETSGTNETLVAGTVRGSEHVPDSPFQTLIVEPLFDMNEIIFVGVLL